MLSHQTPGTPLKIKSGRHGSLLIYFVHAIHHIKKGDPGSSAHAPFFDFPYTKTVAAKILREF